MLEFAMPVGATGYYYVTITGSLSAQLNFGVDTQGGSGTQPAHLGVWIGSPLDNPFLVSDFNQFTILAATEDFYADNHFVIGGLVKAHPHGGKMSLFIYYLDVVGITSPYSMAIFKVTADKQNSITSKPDTQTGFFS